MTFKRKDKVSKVGGDYRFDGIVVGIIDKLSGAVRYAVEDDRGMIHIYNEGQLELRTKDGGASE